MIVYLASPYTHDRVEVMEQRYRAACRAAGVLMKQGYVVFSPVAHSHSVAVHGLEPEQQTNFQFWMDQDLPVLRKCDILMVLMLPGWDRSRGVAREIEVAREATWGSSTWCPI